MTVIVINPNSTATMTDAMTEAARIAEPRLTFTGWTSANGPPSIQGPQDGEVATPPLLELVRRADADGAQGIVIGCFDDTALAEAAEIARCPVLGIGQAAYHKAALRHWRFSVVTTLPISIPILEGNIQAQGLSGSLGRVRASNVPVLDLEVDPKAAERSILAEAERAVAEDDIAALVLGCAGMVHVTAALRQTLPVPVIDPVEAAATGMGWLLAEVL